jgi:hypothetical protein
MIILNPHLTLDDRIENLRMRIYMYFEVFKNYKNQGNRLRYHNWFVETFLKLTVLY